MPDPHPASHDNDVLTRMPLRRAGAILIIGALFVLFSTSAPTLVDWLLLAAGALAAGWLLNSALVVLAPALLLAMAHTDLSSPLPGPSLYYPLTAAASGVGVVVVIARRFRQRMLQTRSARRLARAERYQ